MSLQSRKLSIILLLTLLVVSCKGNNIDEVVKKLSSVSRVVTGIAIQNTLTENGGKVSEIVAELLNVPSGALMDQLKTAKSDSAATSLAAFGDAVQQIPALRTTNVGELHNAMEILAQMRLNSSILKNGTVKDPSDDVKALFGDANFVGIASFPLKVFENFQKLLLKFQTKSFNDIKNSLKQDMGILNSCITKILNAVNKFKSLPNFYKLKETPEMLKEVIYFGNVSKQYKDNVNSLTSLGSQSEDVKEDISGMDVMKNLNPTEISDGLRRTLEIMKSLLEERTNSKSITSGFSNGYDDIKLIKKDLKESDLLKVFSGGKSLDKMAEELSPITQFHEKIKKLENNWKEISGNNADLDTYLTVHTILDQSKPSISQLSNTDSVKGAMDKVNNCVKHLKQPTNPIDYEKVDDLISYGKLVKEKVGEFEKIVEAFQKSENLNEHLAELSRWQNTSEFLSQNASHVEAEQFLSSIRNHPEIGKFTIVIESANKVLGNAQDLPMFLKSTELSKIKPILDSLDGSGLSDALECLNSAQFDQNSLNQVLSLRSDMESLKQNTSAITSTVDYLKKVDKFTTEFTSITAKNRRRRRESKGLKMENSQTIASSLGSGVQSLRDLSDIHESNLLVDKVVKLDDSVHNAVHDVVGKWDITLRTQLTQLLADLKTLDQFAGKKDKKSVPQVWSVFNEAGKIQGVEIDEKTLKDPVAVTLRSDSNPTVQSAATGFESLSSLNLQFSKHHNHLTSASMTISQLQTFFNQYFGLKDVNGNVKESSAVVKDDSSGWIIIIGSVLGGLGIVGALGGGSYLIYQKIDENKRWKNRERYWVYSYYFGDARKDQFETYIAAGRMDELERLVKEGRMINLYRTGYTMLHHAVASQRPEMIEYLIKNGADRNLKNARGLTAEEYAKLAILDEKITHIPPEYDIQKCVFVKEKMTECVEVFEKLEGKTYRHRAPRQIEWKTFQIKFKTNDESLTLFKEKYPQVIDGDYPENTHVVVDTDEDGVFDMDNHDEPREENESPLRKWLCFFSPEMMVSSKWLKLCIDDPKNFYKDYENRVTKVRFNGIVYETVDEWKKWINRRAIRCLSGRTLAIFDGKEEEDLLDLISTPIGGRNVVGAEGIIKYANDESRSPMYWKHGRKLVILVKSDTELPEEIKSLSPEIMSKVDVMSFTELMTWLVSLNGSKDLVENVDLGKKEKKRISGTDDTSKTPSKTGEAGTAPSKPGEPSQATPNTGEPGTTPSKAGEPSTTPSKPGEPSTTPSKAGDANKTTPETGDASKAPSNTGDASKAPSKPGEPGTTPSKPGEPGTTPSKPGEPGTTPSKPGEPGATPSKPGEPAAAPSKPGEPGTTPSKPGEPGATPSKPGEPAAAPSKAGEPGTTPSKPGEPAAAPSKPGEPGTTASKPGEPGTTPSAQPSTSNNPAPKTEEPKKDVKK